MTTSERFWMFWLTIGVAFLFVYLLYVAAVRVASLERRVLAIEVELFRRGG